MTTRASPRAFRSFMPAVARLMRGSAKAKRRGVTPASGEIVFGETVLKSYQERYCWMRVVRRPARPCWSIEYCQERNSSTVSV